MISMTVSDSQYDMIVLSYYDLNIIHYLDRAMSGIPRLSELNKTNKCSPA